jgi:drug/metabolite transporter (DMT)-like permease
VIAFTAYLWLLRNVSPSRVSTYAFVNPVVALFLGWALAGEGFSQRSLLAAVSILVAVALILIPQGARWPRFKALASATKPTRAVPSGTD